MLSFIIKAPKKLNKIGARGAAKKRALVEMTKDESKANKTKS